MSDLTSRSFLSICFLCRFEEPQCLEWVCRPCLFIAGRQDFGEAAAAVSSGATGDLLGLVCHMALRRSCANEEIFTRDLLSLEETEIS